MQVSVIKKLLLITKVGHLKLIMILVLFCV